MHSGLPAECPIFVQPEKYPTIYRIFVKVPNINLNEFPLSSGSHPVPCAPPDRLTRESQRQPFAIVLYDDVETSNGITGMSNVGNIRRNDSNDTMWKACTHAQDLRLIFTVVMRTFVTPSLQDHSLGNPTFQDLSIVVLVFQSLVVSMIVNANCGK
jgi:hypothetical protein